MLPAAEYLFGVGKSAANSVQPSAAPHVRHDPRIDVEQHNRAQIEYFARAGKHAMKPSSAPYVTRQVDALIRFAELSPGERVLDVGCGMGRYTFALAERGLAVEGLDLSQELLDRLRAFDGGQFDIPLHCADVLYPPTELEGGFDAVLGFFTLHHVHDIRACLRSMTRLVKPGGRIVFLEPNPLNPLYYVQMIVVPGMSWQGDKGILTMRASTVFDAMKAAGLERLVLRRFGFFPPFVTNRRWGPRVESVFERVRLWQRFLPFLLFRGDVPR
jgi:SAM-dependent methyltransferase